MAHICRLTEVPNRLREHTLQYTEFNIISLNDSPVLVEGKLYIKWYHLQDQQVLSDRRSHVSMC